MESTLIYLAVGVLLLGLASAGASIMERKLVAGIAKMTAASGYLVLAALAGAPASPFGRTLLAGLCLCWLGDLLLIPSGRGRAFIGGLGSFLLGHVAYAWAFQVRGIDYGWTLGGGVVAVVVGAAVLRWLNRHDVPEHMRTPVRLYVAAIAAMVAMAMGTHGAASGVLIPVGAVAFMASDIFVARERFVAASPWNTGIGLPLYFLGQTLLAWSVVIVDTP